MAELSLPLPRDDESSTVARGGARNLEAALGGSGARDQRGGGHLGPDPRQLRLLAILSSIFWWILA